MPNSSPHRITFANEKGGTGKSTTAVHVAVALAYSGAKVAAIDLDPRQRTLDRYFENRAETATRRGIELPTARCAVFQGETLEDFDALAQNRELWNLITLRLEWDVVLQDHMTIVSLNADWVLAALDE